MKKQILFLGLIFILLASCSTSKTFTAKTYDINSTGVVHKTIVANLDISDKRVSGTASGMGIPSKTLKDKAVALALEPLDADVLIEPIYTTTFSGGDLTVTVTGYPAKYKDFRAITDDDLILFGIIDTTVKKTPNTCVKIINTYE